eukprot:scaffold374_cov271-Pinguiococcus_pyrenoidosus.AAC.16
MFAATRPPATASMWTKSGAALAIRKTVTDRPPRLSRSHLGNGASGGPICASPLFATLATVS